MVEVLVSLGEFKVSLSDLISIKEGHCFEFMLTPGQTLDLFVGDEKIAEARLLKRSEQHYLEISKLLLTD